MCSGLQGLTLKQVQHNNTDNVGMNYSQNRRKIVIKFQMLYQKIYLREWPETCVARPYVMVMNERLREANLAHWFKHLRKLFH